MYFGDLGQAIAALLIFLLLAAILGKWAWKPIVRQLQRRETQILQSIKAAKERQAEAEDLAEHYRQRMERAETDAERIAAGVRKEAEAERRQIVEGAKGDAREAARQARTQIGRARAEALRQMQGTTAELAAQIAETVLGRQLSDDEHRRLVDESLEEIRLRAPGDA